MNINILFKTFKGINYPYLPFFILLNLRSCIFSFFVLTKIKQSFISIQRYFHQAVIQNFKYGDILFALTSVRIPLLINSLIFNILPLSSLYFIIAIISYFSRYGCLDSSLYPASLILILSEFEKSLPAIHKPLLIDLQNKIRPAVSCT
jgi:hypothetical protein